MVFAAPIPDQFSQDSDRIQSAIEQALAELQQRGITGKEATPFLLQRVAELTGGASLRANIELVKNNARIGAQIACEYSKLCKSSGLQFRGAAVPISGVDGQVACNNSSGAPLFIGGAAIDLICKLESQPNCGSADDWNRYLQTSTPAKLTRTLGGVARNAAEACNYALSSFPAADATGVSLIAPVADDEFGRELVRGCGERGMKCDGFVTVPGESQSVATPVYNALLDDAGKLIAAGAAMELLEQSGDEVANKVDSYLSSSQRRRGPAIIIVDANLSVETTEKIVFNSTVASDGVSVPVLFEPTSVPKARRHFTRLQRLPVDFVTPNVEELVEMSGCLCSSDPSRPLPSLSTANTKWQEIPLIHVKADGETTDRLPFHKCTMICTLIMYFDHPSYLLTGHELFRNANEWMPHLLRLTSRVPSVFLKLGSRGVLLAQSLNTCDLFAEAELNSASPASDDRLDSHLMIFNNPSVWEWYHPDSTEYSGSNELPVCLRWYSPRQGLRIVNVTVCNGKPR
jgi:sugar/nucleoside kinase (ribokinase family)